MCGIEEPYMAKHSTLSGSGAAIEIAAGGYTLQAPLVSGRVTEMTSVENASRSDSGRLEHALLNALQGADVTAVCAFEIEVTKIDRGDRPGTTRTARGFTTETGEPAMLLRVPSLGSDVSHALLVTDEAGVSRWLAPRAVGANSPASRGGAGGIEFLLPRDSAVIPATGNDPVESRGPLTKLGRRLVRVLAWATEDLVGQGASVFAGNWERNGRPYALRHYPAAGAGAIDWATIGKARTLLLIHGTFSTAQAAFEQLPHDTLDALAGLYGNRIIAFDHPTLSESPDQNLERFLEMLPPGTDLEIDMITHSRGGLVGREITERQDGYPNAGRRLRVRRAVFVAAPHRGTVITDSGHGIQMLDHYTNLFTNLPDDAFTICMEALFMVAKLVYHGSVRALPGLRSMHPGGDYLARLNSGAAHENRYYALGANFRPAGTSLLSRLGWTAADTVVNGVFGEENDGVVPTAGCYDVGAAAGGFSIEEKNRFSFSPEDGVHHCNYFGDPRTSRQLLQWLGN
jgi:triacylglycerol esterase/lipase EstA (alpha/beta hydrolase family)